MQHILDTACGLDIHKDIITACILRANDTDTPDMIRETFTAMRGDLFRLRNWLTVNKCLNVAMESTGVYWKPVYEVLEEIEGINLCLVNSYHMRNVPGKKDDLKDAKWIAQLHMWGLLEKSFVPDPGIRDLREYARHHVKLVQEGARIVNRIEKLLQSHGFKLSSVLSSIVGVSSTRILEHLCEYVEIDVEHVQMYRERGIKKSSEEIAYAINGKFSHNSQVLLGILLAEYKENQSQVGNSLWVMQRVAEPYMKQIELLSTIPGIDRLSATYIIAEIGVDMTRFHGDAAHLTKWAGLTPRNDESAGKVKSRKILKGNSYTKSILCQCAWATTRTRNTRPSNWYWRNVKRLGQKKAIIAVARKLLVYAFHIISSGEPYDTRLDVIDTEKLNAAKTIEQQSANPETTAVNEPDVEIS